MSSGISTVTAIVNGQSYQLTLNAETGKYEGTVIAPPTSSFNNNAEHYFPVSITATNVAGSSTTVDDTDETLGNSLKLRVKEKNAPTITITSPTSGAKLNTSNSVIQWKVEDDDSGIDMTSISLKVDDVLIPIENITKTAITNGYSCEYTTTLDDGAHSIKFNASDNDGNAATEKTISYTIDTVPPTLSITTPNEGLITNNTSCVVSGITNDLTSSPVTLTVNGAEVNVEPNGSFSTTIILTEGDNTITIVATDNAGKVTTVTRQVTLDSMAPVITGVTLVPNPVDAGASYIISVTVTD